MGHKLFSSIGRVVFNSLLSIPQFYGPLVQPSNNKNRIFKRNKKGKQIREPIFQKNLNKHQKDHFLEEA